MNTVRHHVTEDLLWDYHRGALPTGLRLTVATHLELCPHCRAEAAVFDAVGGALLDDIEGVEMSGNALDLALARIERPEEPVRPAAKPQREFLAGFDLPDTVATARIANRYWAAPGVWMAPIHVDDAPKGSKTFLMHVKAGMTMPEHTHRGPEVTLVLKGRFSDVYGEYSKGDIALCADEHSHSPAILDADCLCLVWQQAAIVPKTWLGKLLQPFARI
jgi:putative transcriptional regulator